MRDAWPLHKYRLECNFFILTVSQSIYWDSNHSSCRNYHQSNLLYFHWCKIFRIPYLCIECPTIFRISYKYRIPQAQSIKAFHLPIYNIISLYGLSLSSHPNCPSNTQESPLHLAAHQLDQHKACYIQEEFDLNSTILLCIQGQQLLLCILSVNTNGHSEILQGSK